MAKRKTSLNIDEGLWRDWIVFVARKFGTSHKISEATAIALKEYMEKNKIK